MNPSNRAQPAPRGHALGPTRLRGKPFGPAAESTEHVNSRKSSPLRSNLHRSTPGDAQDAATSRSVAPPKLLTIDDVADRLSTTERHIRRLVFERRIPYRKIGRFVRFHPDDLTEYIAAQRVCIGEIPQVVRRPSARARR